MIIERKMHFHMGHRIPNHKSKCRNLHGHTYVMEVGVDDKIITEEGSSDEGMVIDFGDLREIMTKHVYDIFDHGFMVYRKDPLNKEFMESPLIQQTKLIVVDFIPTAENIAQYVYKILERELTLRKIKIKYVRIWETPYANALYTREEHEYGNENTN